MESEELEFTVEYQDGYGVLYFENVKASDLSQAKMQIRRMFPAVTIRAVTVVPHNN